MYLRVTNLHPSRKKQGYSIRSKGKVTSTKDRTYLIVPRLDFRLPIPAHVSHGPLNHKQKKNEDKVEISIVCLHTFLPSLITGAGLVLTLDAGS